jgi:N-acetyl-D-muramate 6-phosphate phosphatase
MSHFRLPRSALLETETIAIHRFTPPRAVLFDLDGTLVDSAPDLLAALDHVRRELGLVEPTPVAAGQFVSAGALAMLRAGLPSTFHEQIPQLREQFLRYYGANICVHSTVYAGVEALFERLNAAGIAWGIVTNKPISLASKLISELNWNPGVLIGGDSLATKKPDPATIFEACRILQADPRHTWMVGDDPRDIQAGKNALCAATIACAYGYMGDAPAVESWGADWIAYAVDDFRV